MRGFAAPHAIAKVHSRLAVSPDVLVTVATTR
jgi:hypothetical protein